MNNSSGKKNELQQREDNNLHNTPSPQTFIFKSIPRQFPLVALCMRETNGKHVTIGSAKTINTFLPAVCAWYCLKIETTSGKIICYRKQIGELEYKYRIRNLNSKIDFLHETGLLTIKKGNLLLHNDQSLRNYGINPKEKLPPIKYDTSQNFTLVDIISTIGIEQIMDRSRQAYLKKLVANPDAKTLLTHVFLKYGANRLQLQNDMEYFRLCHEVALIESFSNLDPGQSDYKILHEDLADFNPDINLNQGSYGRIIGYAVFDQKNVKTKKDESKSIGFGHLKRRLSRKGLITLENISAESVRLRHSTTKLARKDDSIYHHRFKAGQKVEKTIWFKPTQIKINHELFYA